MSRALLRIRHQIRSQLFESTSAERKQTYREVRDSHQMRVPYLVMLLLACLVALFGLLGNSPAVVIGAMLISPLMNPFLSAGLALAIGDWPLGRAALKTISLSILAAVTVSALAVSISPLKEATPEILARTNPNLLDLGIAFFSGVAGTFMVVARKSGTTLPGVAIATAVMPPLCVVGFGVYSFDWNIALGALALFITNLAAIIISAACVFLLASFRASDRPARQSEGWGAPVRLAISFVILGLLAIPLAIALVKAATVAQLRQKVKRALVAEVERDPARARLSSGWTVRETPEARVVVEATARTVRYFGTDDVDAVEQALEREVGRPVDLRLEQVKVQQGGLEPDPSVVSGALPSPQPLPPSLTDRVRAYRPAAELAASVLGGQLDRYLIVADDEGVQRLEVFALRDDVPPDDVVAAASRAVAAWSTQAGGTADAVPDLRVFVRPAEPVLLEIATPRARPTPDLGSMREPLERVRALLARDPALRLRLAVETGSPAADGADALRGAVLEALEISGDRVTGDIDEWRVVVVRVAPPAPPAAPEPGRP